MATGPSGDSVQGDIDQVSTSIDLVPIVIHLVPLYQVCYGGTAARP